jgi:hypothetical protein
MRISLGILVAIAVFCLLFFANDRRRDTLRARAEADASSGVSASQVSEEELGIYVSSVPETYARVEADQPNAPPVRDHAELTDPTSVPAADDATALAGRYRLLKSLLAEYESLSMRIRTIEQLEKPLSEEWDQAKARYNADPSAAHQM